jgi:hypothetical protein
MDPLKAGFIDYQAVETIAAVLIRACRDAGTPFDLDVDGAERIMRHFDLDPDDIAGVNLDLLADASSADGTRASVMGSVRVLGRGALDSRLTRIASSLVLVAEGTPKFPFSDGEAARRLLLHMGIDVDKEGDCDLDRMADELGAARLSAAASPSPGMR